MILDLFLLIGVPVLLWLAWRYFMDRPPQGWIWIRTPASAGGRDDDLVLKDERGRELGRVVVGPFNSNVEAWWAYRTLPDGDQSCLDLEEAKRRVLLLAVCRVVVGWVWRRRRS